MLLQDKVAVITGGTAGLGRGIAEAFLREGAKVVLNGRRADKGEKVVAELGAGDRAVFRQGDVLKKEDIESLIDFAVEHFGRIDIMVNNAGWFSELHTIIDETEEVHDRTMAVNEKGVWLGCKYAITAMVKQTNLKTDWDVAAGTYVVQNVAHWNTQKFFTVHQNHLGDGKPAPVIEHVQLLKRYFPYLAFNHSGHYQVGRGYDRAKGTIAIFEVFNERRFNSRGNTTDGPKNIPASALFNATLANSFQNIGL